MRDILDLLMESNILTREPSSKTVLEFYDESTEALGRLVYLYRNDQPRPWRVVPAYRLMKIWSDAATLGMVRDEKGLQSVARQFYLNVMQLYINTEIAEHGTSFMEDLLSEYFDNRDEMEAFVDWAIECSTGMSISDTGLSPLIKRITDTGLSPLIKLTCLSKECSTAEDLLMVCDAMLNVVHPRSDLASWFVEGGSRTLSELATK